MPDKEGWYPDPEFPGRKRYWDGRRWGEVDPEALAKENLYASHITETPLNKPRTGKKSFYAKTLESRMTQYGETFDNFPEEKKKTLIFFALIMFISLSIILGIFSMVMGGYNYARVAALDLNNNSKTSLIDGQYEMYSDGMIYDGEKCAFVGTPQEVNSFRSDISSSFRIIIVGTGVALCSDANDASLVKFTVQDGTAFITSID